MKHGALSVLGEYVEIREVLSGPADGDGNLSHDRLTYLLSPECRFLDIPFHC